MASVENSFQRPIWEWHTLDVKYVCVTIDKFGKVKAHTQPPTYAEGVDYGVWSSPGCVPIGNFGVLPADNPSSMFFWRPGYTPPATFNPVVGRSAHSHASITEDLAKLTKPVPAQPKTISGPSLPVTPQPTTTMAQPVGGPGIPSPHMAAKLAQMKEPVIHVDAQDIETRQHLGAQARAVADAIHEPKSFDRSIYTVQGGLTEDETKQLRDFQATQAEPTLAEEAEFQKARANRKTTEVNNYIQGICGAVNNLAYAVQGIEGYLMHRLVDAGLMTPELELQWQAIDDAITRCQDGLSLVARDGGAQ